MKVKVGGTELWEICKKMRVVSIHGSHNASISFATPVGEIKVIEIERITGYKNAGLAQYKTIPEPDEVVKFCVKLANTHWGVDDKYDLCVSTHIDSIVGHPDGSWEKIFYNRSINSKDKVFGPWHHMCHAASTFYQSPFDKAVIISFDGGGDNQFFNFYVANSRKEGPVEVFNRTDMDLGFAYMIFGDYIHEIKKENSLSDGNLVYSGKLMGLCGYGKVRQDWLEPMKKFYLSKPDGINYKEKLKILWNEIGLEVNERIGNDGGVRGQDAYDIAATSQKVFENVFFDLVSDKINEYQDYPICVTGGCALNVLLNTEIKRRFNRKVYVAPNSNDCGISAGSLLYYLKPEKPVNLMYAGLHPLDEDAFFHYFYPESTKLKVIPISELASKLAHGKIIGVIRGGAEHGPRALGNRSILCNPAIPNMKDILNSKVKNREWYRPFAPVVKIENADKYFDILEESPYMSFAFDVRSEWREKLASITHVDGTARVQTLRQEHNPWLYDLISEFEKISGHGVLLNTSFNVNGMPILSTVREAFQVLMNTQMDGIVVQNTLVMKNE